MLKEKQTVSVEPINHKDVKGKEKLYLKVYTGQEGKKGYSEYFISIGQKTFDAVKAMKDGTENTV